MTLKEEFENSLLICICVVSAAGVALAWAVSQNVSVQYTSNQNGSAGFE